MIDAVTVMHEIFPNTIQFLLHIVCTSLICVAMTTTLTRGGMLIMDCKERWEHLDHTCFQTSTAKKHSGCKVIMIYRTSNLKIKCTVAKPVC